MLRAIYYAKKIIEKQVTERKYELVSNEFTKYQKGFYWTNENIDYYLNLFKFENKEKALTVTSTGDHVFNLIMYGFNDIDTFDINRLTEYFALGLKRAMITEYNYYEFIMMINYIADPNISLESLTEILSSFLSSMEEKHRIFWQEIINYNYKLQKRLGTNMNLIHMLYIGVFATQAHLNNNRYLLDEYCFEELRSRLGRANITFKGTDAIDLSKKFKGNEYDVILLSNILDYAEIRWGNGWNITKLEEYMRSLETITKDNGIIYFKYIISYLTSEGRKEELFHDSSITYEEINDEIYQIPKQATQKECDGMILRRVKIDK